jgi:hypothetical protein
VSARDRVDVIDVPAVQSKERGEHDGNLNGASRLQFAEEFAVSIPSTASLSRKPTPSHTTEFRIAIRGSDRRKP